MAKTNDNILSIKSKLGDYLVETDKLLLFPRGIIGYESLREFSLLELRPQTPLFLLQSIEDPKIGLMVTNPYLFLTDFQLKVGDAEQRLLRMDNSRQVSVMVSLFIPTGKPEQTTLNLAGPILINHEHRLGLQIPQTEPSFHHSVYLYPHNRHKNS